MPASVGAMTGAAPTERPYQPIADPRFSAGNMERINTWDMAVSMPLPPACKIRASIITEKFGAITQTTKPLMERSNPARYNRLVGNRVIKKAVNGIITPIANEYPLVSHCPVVTLIFKSATIAGSAAVRAVESMDEAIQLITIFKKISRRFLSVMFFCVLILIPILYF